MVGSSSPDDASRLPLGQLSPVTIGQGLAALRAIGALLDAKEARVEDSVGFKARGGKPAASAALERKEFQRFSGDFYTLIPHVRPPCSVHPESLIKSLTQSGLDHSRCLVARRHRRLTRATG